MVVENKIIVELKSVAKLNVIMEAQLLNYLRLAGLPVGYLINFCNPRLEWRRFVNTKRQDGANSERARDGKSS